MKRFFKRIHYLITNPGAFVLSYTAEPVGAVFRFVLFVFLLMLTVTGLIRSERMKRELPGIIADTFDGVVLTNDTLHSENGVISPKQWQLQEMAGVITGKTTPVELIPETTIVINPDGNYKSSIVLSKDSLYLNILSVENSEPELKSFAWSDISRFYKAQKSFDIKNIAENYTFFAEVSNQFWPLANMGYLTNYLFHTFVVRGEFVGKEAWLNEFYQDNRFATLGLALHSSLSLILEDIFMYLFMLWILVIIYRRELSHVWVKRSTLKILLNGMIPYLILMPVFAIAGNRADLLNTVALVISAVIISRAFRHHRFSIIAVKKEKETK